MCSFVHLIQTFRYTVFKIFQIHSVIINLWRIERNLDVKILIIYCQLLVLAFVLDMFAKWYWLSLKINFQCIYHIFTVLHLAFKDGQLLNDFGDFWKLIIECLYLMNLTTTVPSWKFHCSPRKNNFFLIRLYEPLTVWILNNKGQSWFTTGVTPIVYRYSFGAAWFHLQPPETVWINDHTTS